MPRLMYGATAGDFTWDGTASVPGVALAVATSPNPATRVTAGLESESGQAVDRITSDAAGEIRFYGTDLPLDLWVATIDGAGNIGTAWYVVRAAVLGAEVSAAAAAATAAATTATNAANALTAGNVIARLEALEAAVEALEAGGVPNAITSPDGSVTTLQIARKADIDAGVANGTIQPNGSRIYLERG